MKIDRISYQKIFPTGMAYLNHKIGVEVQVDEGDDWDDVFKKAKAQVEEWNLQSNPGYAAAMEYMKPTDEHDMGIYENFVKATTVKTEKTSDERRIAVMISDMQSVTDPVVLKTYEFLAKKYPEIKEAYDTKLKELQ